MCKYFLVFENLSFVAHLDSSLSLSALSCFRGNKVAEVSWEISGECSSVSLRKKNKSSTVRLINNSAVSLLASAPSCNSTPFPLPPPSSPLWNLPGISHLLRVISSFK
ncbi:hypothetical protein ILYODFUR_024879 [Ilyodon furcidens]|uniref:Uncharacterized protein n=1 Tax=Ilyodon furcidens TaxID=33524 RepID=A0ABV0TLQ8_9TELE